MPGLEGKFSILHSPHAITADVALPKGTNLRVLIKDQHPGYITWEEFEKNQKLIAENFKKCGQPSRGPVLGGSGLLPGLLRCKRCGRKLCVHYGGKNGKVPTYMCCGERNQTGSSPYCLSFGGLRVDQAVSREVLQVVKPIAMDAAFEALEQVNQEEEEELRLLRLELEQAEFESERAFRQYNRAEPENRLVTSRLEANWNEKLKRVEAVKQRIAEKQIRVRPVSNQEKESLLQLSEDLPRIWTAPGTTTEIQKRILRAVLEEAVVDVDQTRRTILMDLHWKGGVHTRLEVRKNRTGEHCRCTDKEVVDLVRQLATQMSDRGMVPILNKLGYKTGLGNAWTAPRVCSLRHSHGIPNFDPKVPRRFLTAEQAADVLGISHDSVKELIRRGVMAGSQVVPYAPWCISPEELEKEEVKQATAAILRRSHWHRRGPSGENQPALFQENQGF